MCGLDRSSGFGGYRLQHPPKPPTVFGARFVSRRPMKYLKHVLKLHEQYLPKYSYTRYIYPLLRERDLPNIIKLKAKERRIPERRIDQNIVGIFRWYNMSQGVQNSISRSMWFWWVEYNANRIVEMSVFKGFKLWSLSEFRHCRRVKQWEENIALFSQVREPLKKGSRPIHSAIHSRS